MTDQHSEFRVDPDAIIVAASAYRLAATRAEESADQLEAKGGPRRLAEAAELREHARIWRIQADQVER